MQSFASHDLSPATLRSSFTAADPRAEGAARQVSVNRRGISIARTFKGIEMRVAVPITSYVGVVLHGEDATGPCRVMLQHKDPDLSIALWEAADAATDAESAWRSWADYLQLPALRGQCVQSDDEDTDDAQTAEAETSAGVSTLPRRPCGVAMRRPRFLGRRKPGQLERMSVVYKDAELISYE